MAQTLEVESATNQLLCDIWASVESSKLNFPNDVVIIRKSRETQKKYDTQDLPISQFIGNGDRDRYVKASLFVDMIMDFVGAVDENALSESAKQGKYDEMPAPFGPKIVNENLGYYLQAIAIEKGANRWFIIALQF